MAIKNMRELMQRLGNPQKELKVIHIGGTNGKGSVSQIISSSLQKAGYRVGVFTSPHLINPEERMRINNKDISHSKFEEYSKQVHQEIERLREEDIDICYFEILTAIGLLYFKEEAVDFVVLEVGLGGRLDATNIIESSVASIITKISIDHKDYLGDTLPSIAAEKAGIIKPKGLLITPIQEQCINEVMLAKSQVMEAEIIWMNPENIKVISVDEKGTTFKNEKIAYKTQLIGEHQAYNASLAICTIKVLREKQIISISDEQIQEGVYEAKWAGRFEKVYDKPTVFLDGAHNVDGIKALKNTLKYFNHAYTIGLVGILQDKEVDEMLELIENTFELVIVTQPDNVRAMPAEELARKIKNTQQQVEVIPDIKEAIDKALELAKNKVDSQVIGFGSLYMIGDIKQILLGKKC